MIVGLVHQGIQQGQSIVQVLNATKLTLNLVPHRLHFSSASEDLHHHDVSAWHGDKAHSNSAY